MPPKPKKAVATVPPPKMCDNHPDRVGTFWTTSNGRHQEIVFCNECIPAYWR